MNNITFYEERFTYKEEWQGDVDIYADGIYQSSFAEDGESKFYGDPILKLAEYEDAEEQGLLLRLPCKVGTSIYMINHYWIDEGHICGIAEADDLDCFCYKVYCDPDDYTIVAIADFNITWFLTKEEAEAALKNLQKQEGKQWKV